MIKEIEIIRIFPSQSSGIREWQQRLKHPTAREESIHAGIAEEIMTSPFASDFHQGEMNRIFCKNVV
jgi:hypothetical protein